MKTEKIISKTIKNEVVKKIISGISDENLNEILEGIINDTKDIQTKIDDIVKKIKEKIEDDNQKIT